MKVLFVGEIVAEPGRKVVKQYLPEVLKENEVDFVISNIENLSGGRGFTEENAEEMRKAGIDFFTGGDHIFWQKGTEDYIERMPLVRPANYPEGTLGQGYQVIDTGKNGKILVISLMGRTFAPTPYIDDPFRKADEILSKFNKEDLSAIVVDFHAESTSEKHALAFYLDGRVDAVVGTHTHVPTCDQRVLPKGTIFLSDVGMCGAIDSSIGVKIDLVIEMFLTGKRQKFEWESAGTKAFRSVLFDTVKKTVVRIDKSFS